MELRGCSHLHFIQAIKHGLIVKTLNVGYRGRPALVFKKVEDVYEAEDAKSPHPLPVRPPKDEFRGFYFDCDEAKIKIPDPSIGQGKPIKTDPELYEINCNNGSDKSDRDVDDKMTLKQLMEMHGTKKRKFSRSVDLSKDNTKSCASLKQEYSDLLAAEDDPDLKESISSFKSKIKKKNKCINKCLSSPSQSFTAISVLSKEISSDQDMQFSASAPISLKVEALEPDYSECSSVICADADSSIGRDSQVDSSGVSDNEMLEAADECVQEDGVSISFTEEPRSCVVNKISYDFLHRAEIESLHDVRDRDRDTMKVDDSDINSKRCSISRLLEMGKQEEINHPPFHNDTREILHPDEDCRSNVYDSPQCHSISHEILLQESGSAEAQRPDIVINHSLQSLGPNHGGGAFAFRDDKDYLPSNIEAAAITSPVSNSSSHCKSSPLSSVDSPLALVDDESPISEEKQSRISDSGCTEEGGSAKILYYDSTNEPLTSEVTDKYYHSVLQHPPERLLSTRKAISPTSQERLCKAMKAIELHNDIQHYYCTGELTFEKRTKYKSSSELGEVEIVGSAEGTEQICGAEVTIKCNEIIRKPKNDSKTSHPKGVLKIPRPSQSLPRVSTGCTSIRNCSRSAIEFSQRQMHDIEKLAMKLTNEMNSMKNVLTDNLHLESEACTGTSLNNADKLRSAVENATKAEETARKWLSIMGRDCIRFCKIMRGIGKDPDDTGNAVTKGRKKISFADEAGGELCHVKFFKDDMS